MVIDKPRIAIARQHARKLIKESGCKKVPIFLSNVVRALKTEHSLLVRSWDFGDNVSGVLFIEKEGSAIGYNEKQHVHRQRFTVAHEIGHLILGHTCNGRKSEFDSASHIETEANQFAAELLMPLEFLKKDLKSNPSADIAKLAELYWVSQEAMGWRVQDPTILSALI